MVDGIFGSTMNLWDATERIGVLYVLFGLCDDFTAFQYLSLIHI